MSGEGRRGIIFNFPQEKKKKVKRKKEGEFFGCGFLQYDTVM